jgi:glycosyltransferase involved in cell wall biosynthesis
MRSKTITIWLLLPPCTSQPMNKSCSADSAGYVEVLYFAPSFLGLTGISENALRTVVALEERFRNAGVLSSAAIEDELRLGAVSDTPESTSAFRASFRPLPWAQVVGGSAFSRLLEAEGRGEKMVVAGGKSAVPNCVPRPQLHEHAARMELRNYKAELLHGGSKGSGSGGVQGEWRPRSRTPPFRICIFHGAPHERLLSAAGFLSVSAALNSTAGCSCDYTIARTVMEASLEESDKMRFGIPRHWLLFLSQFDEVWLPSRTLVPGLLKNSGTLGDVRVRVVPEPIPMVERSDEAQRRQLRLEGQRRLRAKHGIDAEHSVLFLSVFSFARRKAPFKLIQAFCEFGKQQRLRSRSDRLSKRPVLVIKSSSEPGVAGSDLSWLRKLVGTMVDGSGGAFEVVVYRGDADEGIISRREYDALLHAADAFVLPSRAEGFCRPCAEAMAAGAIAIVTGAGGQREFMHEGNSLLLNYTVRPVPHDILYGASAAGSDVPIGGDTWARQYEFMMWPDPDIDHLIHLLGRVFEAYKGGADSNDSDLPNMVSRATDEVAYKCSAYKVAELIESYIREAVLERSTENEVRRVSRVHQQEATREATALVARAMRLWHDAIDGANAFLRDVSSGGTQSISHIESYFDTSIQLLENLCRASTDMTSCGSFSLYAQVKSDYDKFISHAQTSYDLIPRIAVAA